MSASFAQQHHPLRAPTLQLVPPEGGVLTPNLQGAKATGAMVARESSAAFACAQARRSLNPDLVRLVEHFREQTGQAHLTGRSLHGAKLVTSYPCEDSAQVSTAPVTAVPDPDQHRRREAETAAAMQWPGAPSARRNGL